MSVGGLPAKWFGWLIVGTIVCLVVGGVGRILYEGVVAILGGAG